MHVYLTITISAETRVRIASPDAGVSPGLYTLCYMSGTLKPYVPYHIGIIFILMTIECNASSVQCTAQMM